MTLSNNSDGYRDNSEVQSILERVLTTATVVGEAFRDEKNANDPELIFYATELLR